MNTTWDQRRRIEQAVMEGEAITSDDAVQLIADADQAEVLDETLDALEQALESIGYKLIDVTTDDSDATELQLVSDH